MTPQKKQNIAVAVLIASSLMMGLFFIYVVSVGATVYEGGYVKQFTAPDSDLQDDYDDIKTFHNDQQDYLNYLNQSKVISSTTINNYNGGGGTSMEQFFNILTGTSKNSRLYKTPFEWLMATFLTRQEYDEENRQMRAELQYTKARLTILEQFVEKELIDDYKKKRTFDEMSGRLNGTFFIDGYECKDWNGRTVCMEVSE